MVVGAVERRWPSVIAPLTSVLTGAPSAKPSWRAERRYMFKGRGRQLSLPPEAAADSYAAPGAAGRSPPGAGVPHEVAAGGAAGRCRGRRAGSGRRPGRGCVSIPPRPANDYLTQRYADRARQFENRDATRNRLVGLAFGERCEAPPAGGTWMGIAAPRTDGDRALHPWRIFLQGAGGAVVDAQSDGRARAGEGGDVRHRDRRGPPRAPWAPTR